SPSSVVQRINERLNGHNFSFNQNTLKDADDLISMLHLAGNVKKENSRVGEGQSGQDTALAASKSPDAQSVVEHIDELDQAIPGGDINKQPTDQPSVSKVPSAAQSTSQVDIPGQFHAISLA